MTPRRAAALAAGAVLAAAAALAARRVMAALAEIGGLLDEMAADPGGGD